MNKRKDIVKMGGNPVTLIGDEVKVGDKAKDFTALNTDLSEFNLSSTNGKVRIILKITWNMFYNAFNEMASKLGDVVILTVSMDLPFAQERFCGAKGIDKVVTISDHKDADFGEKYGFLMEELRLLARGIVIIDKDGLVQYIEYVPEATDHPDYDKAYEEAKKLI